MDVYFTTADFGEEAASLAAAAAGRAPSELYHVFGEVVLVQDGQAPLVIYDDLTMLIFRLCLAAPEAIRADGSADVRLIDWPGVVKLRREAGEINVAGPQGEDTSFPAEELLEALTACGKRFNLFLRDLSRTAPQFSELAEAQRS